MTTPRSLKRHLTALGKKGGRARMKRLTHAQRRALGRKAAKARWAKERGHRQ